MIKAIVAAGKNWEIGKKNGLLFKLPGDMIGFKAMTMNSIVVMGENTLLSFPGGKPLKDRVNIVLCPEGREYKDCICLHDLDQVVRVTSILSLLYDVWVIGGGMMYKSMLPYCDAVIVNKVYAEDKEATVFFPNMDEQKDFTLSMALNKIEDNGYITELCYYTRNTKKLD